MPAEMELGGHKKRCHVGCLAIQIQKQPMSFEGKFLLESINGVIYIPKRLWPESRHRERLGLERPPQLTWKDKELLKGLFT